MGAKTALLAFADGDLRPALLGAARSERTAAERLVREVLPGYLVESAGHGALQDHTYPPDDITYAAVMTGAEMVCDRRLVLGRPSELPGHVLNAGAGRQIVVHGMHSAVDWPGFAVWEDGRLVR